MKANTALVLEGGGARGMFTAALLEAFLDQDIEFDSVYGVSAGASYGASFVSRQKGRNRVVNRYVGARKQKSSWEFITHKLKFSWLRVYEELDAGVSPYDYHVLRSTHTRFVANASNCITGKPEYFYLNDKSPEEFRQLIVASGSLPGIAPIVNYEGKQLLDGGLSDSIPFEFALKEGAERIVVILTQPLGYRKSELKMKPVLKAIFHKQPSVYQMLEKRSAAYNATLDRLAQLEHSGKAFVIRPEAPLEIKRTEWDAEKTEKIYEEGMAFAPKIMPCLINWLNA